MKHITTQDALRALEEAVAEKGEDYVYPDEERNEDGACHYTWNGVPSCIVGHALVSLGVPPEAFNEHQNDMFTDAFAEQLQIPVSERARRALRLAQSEQDNGGTWGNALKLARRAAAVES